MRLLVTGGAGFIGSAVVRHCLRHTEYQVLNIDNLTYAGCLENVAECVGNPRYEFKQLDICDAAALTDAIKHFDPDAIMHLAAESHVDRSIDGPGSFISTNIIGTYNILQAARGHWEALPSGRRDKFRFHHVSTDEVFGSLGSTGYFVETSPYAPNSPYSASKASSDMLVRAWYHTYGLPAVISNCSNNYGPYQFPEKLLPVVILAALNGKQIPVYGSGSNIRDWLFVEDHVTALLAILSRGLVGETYNVGGNSELTNIDLVKRICRVMNELRPTSPHFPHEKLIKFVEDRPGHDQRYAIDASKIQQALNWTPQTSIDEGLRKTVEWYLANRAWWEAIQSRGFEANRLGLKASV